MLEKMGDPIGPSYYSEMETGKKPLNDDWRAVFTRAYGESPDDWEDPWATATELSENALVDAIREQAAAISALADAIREDRDRISPEARRSSTSSRYTRQHSRTSAASRG
jgi:hypothetical protein